MNRGLFITGTDTGIGKTTVSAAVLHRYRNAPLNYWKPIQTGIEQDDDTAEVRRLAPHANIFDKGIRLPRPVSPHLAARWANTTIQLESFPAALPDGTWIVEGAGGVLVPVNETQTIADLIHLLQLPVLVVARTTLGTINHTLLTLEALRARSLTIAGVILNGDHNQDNLEAIEHYGRTRVLATLPRLNPLDPSTLAEWGVTHLDPSGALQDHLA